MSSTDWLTSKINLSGLWGRWMPGAPAANEGGVDLPEAAGTPIYALATGLLQGYGDFWHSSNLYTPGSGAPGYGVLTERVNVPGMGLEDIYYQHLDLANNFTPCQGGNCNNQVVQAGQLIGYIHPGVNEVEVGANANWGGVWGGTHPGPWLTDPRAALSALANNPNSNVDLSSGGTNPILCQILCAASIDPSTCQLGCSTVGNTAGSVGSAASALTNPQTWIRTGIIALGAIIVLIGVYKLF